MTDQTPATDETPEPDETARPDEPTEPHEASEAGEPGETGETGEAGEPAGAGEPGGAGEPAGAEAAPGGQPRVPVRSGPFSPTKLVVALLLGLLGFTFVVQVRSVAEDSTAAALGQEDLVTILANLDTHEERLREDIAELQETQRRLSNAGQSQEEALAEASRRADELGILAGTLPATGPGIRVTFHGDPAASPAPILLDAVQELRSAGAEAMQITGGGGTDVRVVASTYFSDAEVGIVVDGQELIAPYTLVAIGDPATLAPALGIPGGVVESVHQHGGTVTVQEQPGGVDVSAVREPPALEHARPDS